MEETITYHPLWSNVHTLVIFSPQNFVNPFYFQIVQYSTTSHVFLTKMYEFCAKSEIVPHDWIICARDKYEVCTCADVWQQQWKWNDMKAGYGSQRPPASVQCCHPSLEDVVLPSKLGGEDIWLLNSAFGMLWTVLIVNFNATFSACEGIRSLIVNARITSLLESDGKCLRLLQAVVPLLNSRDLTYIRLG